MFWSFAYSATEYVPPAEKSIYVNFAGAYVSDDVIEDLTAGTYEAFPEMELIEFYGLTWMSATAKTAMPPTRN